MVKLWTVQLSFSNNSIRRRLCYKNKTKYDFRQKWRLSGFQIQAFKCIIECVSCKCKLHCSFLFTENFVIWKNIVCNFAHVFQTCFTFTANYTRNVLGTIGRVCKLKLSFLGISSMPGNPTLNFCLPGPQDFLVTNHYLVSISWR